MSKLIFIAFVFITATSFSQNSKISISGYGGVNYSNFVVRDDTSGFTYKGLITPNIGAKFLYAFTEKVEAGIGVGSIHHALRTENKNIKSNGVVIGSNAIDFTYFFFEFPIFVKYNIVNNEKLQCFVSAGMQNEYAYKAKSEVYEINITDTSLQDFEVMIRSAMNQEIKGKELEDAEINRYQIGVKISTGFALKLKEYLYLGAELFSNYHFNTINSNTKSEKYNIYSLGVKGIICIKF